MKYEVLYSPLLTIRHETSLPLFHDFWVDEITSALNKSSGVVKRLV